MAKRIVPGMDIHIRPVSVKKEEHGSMRGRVLSISELSISKAELDAILRNSELTNNLMGDTAPLLAKIEVFLDKGTPSGFAWWGGQGPPFAVTRGTRVAVDVIVDTRRPSRSSSRPCASCSASKDDRPSASRRAGGASARRPSCRWRSTECGAAALAIVLAYLGRRVPLEELRVACGVSRDGSKAGSIVRAARQLRPRGRGLPARADEALAGPFPVDRLSGTSTISWWSRVPPRPKVFLNDPAIGPAHASPARNSARASPASSLAFEPGPDFKPGGDVAGLMSRLRTGCRVYGSAIAGSSPGSA